MRRKIFLLVGNLMSLNKLMADRCKEHIQFLSREYTILVASTRCVLLDPYFVLQFTPSIGLFCHSAIHIS